MKNAQNSCSFTLQSMFTLPGDYVKRKNLFKSDSICIGLHSYAGNRSDTEMPIGVTFIRTNDENVLVIAQCSSQDSHIINHCCSSPG